MQRVLVTGATGAIGRVLVRRLVELGFYVRAFVREGSDISGLDGVGSIVKGDILSEKDLVLACRGIDTVFHLAAKLHINNPDPDEEREIYRINTLSTRLLVRASWRNNVKRFIYFSTINVYGCSEKGVIFDETSPPDPLTTYARSKLDAEKYVLSLADRTTGQPCGVVLRLATVFGPNMKGNYRLLSMMAKAGIRIIPGDGKNRRTLVHENDAVDAAIRAASFDGICGRIFNVTDGRLHSIREIYSNMLDHYGRRKSFVRLDQDSLFFIGAILDKILAFLRIRSFFVKSLEKFNEDMAVGGRLFIETVDFKPSVEVFHL